MDFIVVTLLGLVLSADAFAVSAARNISEKLRPLDNIKLSIAFGSFQAVMPIIGWYLGRQFLQLISEIDHWIAFLLLSGVGIRMIYPSVEKNWSNSKGNRTNTELNNKIIAVLALATSIDALAIGLALSVLTTDIFEPAILIGAITFVISLLGCYLGNLFGAKLGKNAEIFGGIILVLIGLRILLEHLKYI